MARPRTPPPQPPTDPTTGHGAEAAAALAAGGATVASLGPAAAGLKTEATATEVGAGAATAVLAALLKGLSSYSAARQDTLIPELGGTLRAHYPEMADTEIEKLAREELGREREFRKRVADRLRRDITAALKLDTPEARRAALKALLEREKRYVKMREEAMHERVVGRAEMDAVKGASPQGAYWWLSPYVAQHTPDCVALGHRFWPWSVIEAVGPPPRHPGCACELLTLGEAVDRDYMDAGQVPDPKDAMRLAKKLLKAAGEVMEHVEPAHFTGHLRSLQEGASIDGAMVALYPSKDVARKLAGHREADEEPAHIHLTLAFLGPDAEKLEPAHEAIRKAVARAAAKSGPLKGVVGGIGVFSGDPKADERPLVALADVPGLNEFRAQLAKELGKNIGPDNHGFTPHITLRYIPKGEQPPKAEPPAQLPLDFDRVCLVWGGKREEFTLGEKSQLAEAAGTIEDELGHVWAVHGGPLEECYWEPATRTVWVTGTDRPEVRDALQAVAGVKYTEFLTAGGGVPANSMVEPNGVLEEAARGEAEHLAKRGHRYGAEAFERYAKGLAKGGQFKPRRGASSLSARRGLRAIGRAALKTEPTPLGRRLMRKLAPELPRPPAERRDVRRAVKIEGRTVHVPEQRAFSRQINGHTYTSPPGSTNVYRDGEPFGGDQGRTRGPRGELTVTSTGASNTAVAQRVEAERGERQDDHTTRIMAALAQHDPAFPPVDAGMPGEAADRALLDAGFLETGLTRGRDTADISYAAPDGASRLVVAYDLDTGRIAGTAWEPRRPQPPGRPLTREPRTVDEFAADLDSLARTVARRNGRHAHLGEIHFAAHGDPNYSDHAGEHHWDGDVTLGEDFAPSILRAASARARGAERSPQQRRMLYASAQSGAHEMLHAAFPTGKEYYERQEQLNLNEAMVEELSHLEGVRTLARWGSDDALRWRADNPADPKALGTYQPERAALAGVLDAAGVPPELREPYLLHLLGTPPDQRFAELGRRLPGGEADARQRMLALDRPTRFAPILLPDLEPTVGGPEPFLVGSVPVDVGDRVHVRRRILQDGEMTGQDATGTVEMLRGGEGADWTAKVAYDNGDVDHGVLPSMIADVVKTRPPVSFRVWGAEADHIDHAGERFRPGDTIRYGRTDGKTSDAVLTRILRARDPDLPDTSEGWALEAITTTDSARLGARVVLTPSNTDGRLELLDPGGQTTSDTGHPGNQSHRSWLGVPTVEDKAQARPYFDFPPGTRVVPADQLQPSRQELPSKVDRALAYMQDAAAGRRRKRLPLAVHDGSDGRLVILDGNATFQAGQEMGMGAFPVMPDALQQIDKWIATRELHGARVPDDEHNKGVLEALHESRAIIQRGDGSSEIFAEAIRRGPLEGGGDFNEGLQTGFRTVYKHLRDSNQALGLTVLGARNYGGWGMGWKAHDGDDPDPDPDEGDPAMPKWFQDKLADWEDGDSLTDDEPHAPWTQKLYSWLPKKKSFMPPPRPKPAPFTSKKPGGPPLEAEPARDWKSIPDVDVGEPLGPSRDDALAEFYGDRPPPKPYLKRLPKGVQGPQQQMVPRPPQPNISAGVVMVEPDGRVWAMEPTNHFGDYMAILPKGRVDAGETDQQAALRELFEETGMHGRITGLVGDYAGSTGITRYYLAERTGGKPTPSWESHRVMLEPPEKIPFRMRDRVALGDATGLPGPAPFAKGKALDPQKLYGFGGVAVDPAGNQWKVGRVTGTDRVESVDLMSLDTSEDKTLNGARRTWAGWTFFPKPKHGAGGARQQANQAGAQDDAGVVTLTKPAGGSNGAYFAQDATGKKWIVKSYKGNIDRVATELLANSVYRKLDIAVPEAGSLEFDGTPALAYPIVEGQPGGYGLPIKGSTALAEGFMADALLANWDVVGLEYDNMLWPTGTTEVKPDTPATRIDQGGTFQYRAQGQLKPYGPVPAEVWSMASGQGQANGRYKMTEAQNKAQAAKIEKVLTPDTVDALVDAAPFENKTMREEVRAALKARVAWMGAYSRGEVDEHGPVEGKPAAAAMAAAKPEPTPEQGQAEQAWLDGWDEQINEKLRAGSPLTPAEGAVATHLDGLVASSRVPEETLAYFALPAAETPEDGWEGKRLTDPGFLGLSLDKTKPAGQLVRVRLRKGSAALFTGGDPEVVLGRGTSLRVSGEQDGVLEATYVGRDFLASRLKGGGAKNEPLEPLQVDPVGAITDELERDFPGVAADVTLDGDTLDFNDLEVPEADRGGGQGTEILARVKAAADEAGLRVRLLPGNDETDAAGEERLRQWYLRNGFRDGVDDEFGYMIYDPAPATQLDDVGHWPDGEGRTEAEIAISEDGLRGQEGPIGLRVSRDADGRVDAVASVEPLAGGGVRVSHLGAVGGTGAGTELLRQVMADAGGPVELDVADGDASLTGYYERLGFAEHGGRMVWSPPEPYEASLYHGSRAAGRIRAEGIQVGQGGIIYATSHPAEAEGYGGGGGTAVPVKVRLVNPLRAEGGPEAAKKLRALGIEPPNGDREKEREMASRLRERGYDGMVIRYPEDMRDPSYPVPEREVAMAFDATAVTPGPAEPSGARNKPAEGDWAQGPAKGDVLWTGWKKLAPGDRVVSYRQGKVLMAGEVEKLLLPKHGASAGLVGVRVKWDNGAVGRVNDPMRNLRREGGPLEPPSSGARNQGDKPFRTRGGTGVPTKVDAAAAFLRNQTPEDRAAVSSNPRGLAKAFGISVGEAEDVIRAANEPSTGAPNQATGFLERGSRSTGAGKPAIANEDYELNPASFDRANQLLNLVNKWPKIKPAADSGSPRFYAANALMEPGLDKNWELITTYDDDGKLVGVGTFVEGREVLPAGEGDDILQGGTFAAIDGAGMRLFKGFLAEAAKRGKGARWTAGNKRAAALYERLGVKQVKVFGIKGGMFSITADEAKQLADDTFALARSTGARNEPAAGFDGDFASGAVAELPAIPEFLDKAHAADNQKVASQMLKLAQQGALEKLEALAGGPSPKLESYRKSLVAALGVVSPSPTSGQGPSTDGPGPSLPPVPHFKDKQFAAENTVHAQTLLSLAQKGDTAALTAYAGSKSPKVNEYRQALLKALGGPSSEVAKQEDLPKPKPIPPPQPVPPVKPVPPADLPKALEKAKEAAGADAAAFQPGDSSIASPETMAGRVNATVAILGANAGVPDAVLHIQDEPAARAALLGKLVSGEAGDRALAEYAFTPMVDLEILSGIHVKDTPQQGQAVAYLNTRKVQMGSTSVTGDFRHELGHTLRAAWGGAGGHSGKTPLTEFVAAEYKKAVAKAAGATGPPPSASPKAKWDYWFEHGTIGKRALDNMEETAAEHYRAYHRAAFQVQHPEAPDHNPEALNEYRKAFPEWARVWDAWYTGQLLRS